MLPVYRHEGKNQEEYPKISKKLSPPFIVGFESFFCPDGNIIAVAVGAFIEVFSHFFAHFLCWQASWFDAFFAVFAPKCHLTTIGAKGGFAFFPKSGNIDEIRIARRHIIRKKYLPTAFDRVLRRGVFGRGHAR